MQGKVEVRPLERADLPAVGALLRAHLPAWPWDEAFLATTLIDHPWVDPELPSLVAAREDSSVAGFIGSQVRRMRLGDRELRGVCCSHLVVDPEARTTAAGARLLRNLLAGPQDATWSETPTADVVRMWRTFGGEPDHARALDWMLVLRPLRWLGTATAAVARRGSVNRRLIPVGALPLQAAGPRLAARAFPEQEPGVRGEDASVAQIIESLPAITRRMRVKVAYDEPYLSYLFEQVGSVYGSLVHRLVRREGRPIGWYAYLPGRAEAARVLHVSADELEAGAVVGDLVEHARASGQSVLTGRLEPNLDGALRRRLAAVGFARQPVIHARDPELRAALATSHSLLTRLDSEWFVD